MRYLSVCSGIEAASVAWGPLGWQAAAFSEIEPFPCAVLAHYYPDVPNLGDMTLLPDLIRAGQVEAPDILCGGTPCQAFSVAGLRKSLDDARGNLSLTFCEIADAIDHVRGMRGQPPSIIFWENVPGVLSTRDNAFGCFLAGLAGEDEPLQPPGRKWANAGAVYGPARAIAWRVLDAQYFGLAQRRRRVFVVASARDGFDPAAVLFEFECVRRDTAPRREARKGAPTIPARSTGGGGLGTDFDCDGGVIQAPSVQVCPTLRAGGNKTGGDRPPGTDVDTADSLIPVTTHTLRGEGFDASEDGTGRGQTIVVHGTQDPCVSEHAAFALGRNNGGENVVAFSCKDYGGDAGPLSPTLRSMGHDGSHANAGGQVAFDPTQITSATNRSNPRPGDTCYTLAKGAHAPAIAFSEIAACRLSATGAGFLTGNEQMSIEQNVAGVSTPSGINVRRLTPRECERLMGFPDDYTLVPLPLKGRQTRVRWASDSARYKALGNSWAVPVVRWIGERINAAVEKIEHERKAT